MTALHGKTGAVISPRWYVVHTDYRAERLAKSHLSRINGLGVYLPVRIAAPKSRTATVPFLPGYLFIRPDPVEPHWNDVFTALGVRSVLGVGGKPTPAPAALVPRIRDHEINGVVQVEHKKRRDQPLPFKPGDVVKISGSTPWAGYQALFEVGDQHRVLVLLSLFGRQTRVELTPDQLSSVCAVDAKSESACKLRS